jgi:biopolymer transport protein ExbD
MMSLWARKAPDSAMPNITPLVEFSLFLVIAVLANAAGASLGDLPVQLASVPDVRDGQEDDPTPVLRIAIKPDPQHKGIHEYWDYGTKLSLAEMRERIAGLEVGTKIEIIADRTASAQAISEVLSAAYRRGITPSFKVEEGEEAQP